MKMLFSEIKDLMHDYSFDNSDLEDFAGNFSDSEDDFTVGNYRFIDEDAIDEIMQGELKSDLYMLGCFNDWFLADVMGIDLDVIQEMQKVDAFTAIGKLVISLGCLEELQKDYARADGYGHHFNGYDGSQNELDFADENTPSYYVFRVN
jgi:hypothetical protein